MCLKAVVWLHLFQCSTKATRWWHVQDVVPGLPLPDASRPLPAERLHATLCKSWLQVITHTRAGTVRVNIQCFLLCRKWLVRVQVGCVVVVFCVFQRVSYKLYALQTKKSHVCQIGQVEVMLWHDELSKL